MANHFSFCKIFICSDRKTALFSFIKIQKFIFKTVLFYAEECQKHDIIQVFRSFLLILLQALNKII